MKIIIMGCGRVGEQVARLMADEGHAVIVIDVDPRALDRLGADFKGKRVAGVGFDREVLVHAGIEDADAFAATSASDNANVIAARIARNVFHVPRVVARLYDPRRAEIYQRLGLLTISSTNWGAERIRELLTHSDLDPLMTFGNGEVCLLSIDTPLHWLGHMVKEIIIPGEIQILAITRQGHALIPVSGSDFRPGDIVHLAVLASSLERFKELMGLGEAG
jgi:trk system potassium uptake protein TrkA